MSTLTVGKGAQFTTIAAAVTAAQNGDIIEVKAGTYTNDFATISKSITLQAVGGEVNMVATKAPPNLKGMLTIGTTTSAPDVTITGFSFSGVKISAGAGGNGAGIRYQSGNLTLSDDWFHNNQDGLLATPLVAGTGTITIDRSEFGFNGSGTGQTHNIYVGEVASLSITDSYIHDAKVGHEIKSRAAVNTIEDNRIFDNGSNDSYSIDLPNGGQDTISGNTIEKGLHSETHKFISFLEAPASAGRWANSSLNVTNNTFVNDQKTPHVIAVWNANTVPNTATVSGNSLWNIAAAGAVLGPADITGSFTSLPARPKLGTTHPWLLKQPAGDPPASQDPPPPVSQDPPPPVSQNPPPPVSQDPPPPADTGHVLTVGKGGQFTTIAAAVKAAQNGDIIDVKAGTYTNDFATISKSITLQAVGGEVNMVATKAPPNLKGMLTIGTTTSAPDVTITGFSFSGVKISARAGGNGAGIRYQSGNLTLSNDWFHNNQDGLLATPLVAGTGTITIDRSEFGFNGSGTGQTHGIYVGKIASLSITDSYIHNTKVGHEIKSRAAVNTIEDNRIFDNGSNDSYSIDLPNGGQDTISGNTIEKGLHSETHKFISFLEAPASAGRWANSSLNVTNNTFINDQKTPHVIAVWNANTIPNTATVSGNSLWNIAAASAVLGPADITGSFTSSPARPKLSTTHPWLLKQPAGAAAAVAASSAAATHLAYPVG